MAEERGYDARVRVGATAPLPGVSADSFGAGVGQAVSQAGAVIQQEQLENARLDRELRDNAEWSAFLVEDAKRREAVSTAAREGRLSDAPGHAARIGAEVDKAAEELLTGLTSERLKQQGRARIADWGGTLRTREADYEFVRGQEIAVERFQEQRDIVEGMVRRADDPKVYAHELRFQMDAIAQLNTSDEVKQKLLDETEQRFAVSFLRGMTDRDPQAAIALIDSGAFDGVITGDQVEVLRNGAGVEVRRVQAQKEREETERKATLRGQIQFFEQAESMGLVQDDATYDQAITAAQALGDEQLVLKLTGLKANNQFTKVWGPENATALQREQRITELAGKDKRSPQENLELKFLRDRAPTWAGEEARDPVSQAARRGGAGAPPVIDLNDGESWNARAQWMAGRGEKVGFTDVELRELQDAVEAPNGELGVMAQLDKVRDPFAKARMAEQIKPNDPTFRQMAMLRPQVRATVRQGRKAMVNNPRFFSNLDPDVEEVIGTMDANINAALREYDDDLKLGTRETARQFIAGLVTARGAGDFSGAKSGEALDRELRVAVAVALGGRVVTDKEGKRYILGGIDDWNGRPYVLPSTMNEGEFKRRLQAELTSTKNPPVNPDGSRANLYRAVPVAVGGGFYEFETLSGAPIKAQNGRNYRVRLGQ
jgi:hypothetical protein